MPSKTKFKYWGWTGDNMYFIRGSNDNISIGAGELVLRHINLFTYNLH